MKSKDPKGVVRRRMVSDRSRQFFGDVAQQAGAGLPEFQQRIERQIHQQHEQQPQAKASQGTSRDVRD